MSEHTWWLVAALAESRIRALPDRVLWAMGFCVRVRREEETRNE